MKLLETQNEKLYIYVLEEDKKAISDYKKNEMEKIPEHLRVIQAATNCEGVLSTGFSTIDGKEIDFCTKNQAGDNLYHVLEPTMGPKNLDLLNKYYGHTFEFSDNRVKINESVNADINYLLFKNKTYKYDVTNGAHNIKRLSSRKVLPGILNVTKELFDLELFFWKKYNELTNEEIKNILGLLYKGKTLIDKINLRELKKLYDLNLISGYDKIAEQVRTDKKVLKLLK